MQHGSKRLPFSCQLLDMIRQRSKYPAADMQLSHVLIHYYTSELLITRQTTIRPYLVETGQLPNTCGPTTNPPRTVVWQTDSYTNYLWNNPNSSTPHNKHHLRCIYVSHSGLEVFTQSPSIHCRNTPQRVAEETISPHLATFKVRLQVLMSLWSL